MALAALYLGVHYPSDILAGALLGTVLGRLGAMKVGIVGMPNAGKSSLFNALTKAGAEAANYPFTTIEPNVAVVPVRDERLERGRGDCRRLEIVWDTIALPRHRRPRPRRARGRGARQQVPGQHPRDRRDRPRRPRPRTTPTSSTRRAGRPGARHRDDRDRADLRRPRAGRAPPRARRRAGARRRQGGDRRGGVAARRSSPRCRPGRPARTVPGARPTRPTRCATSRR